MLLLPRTTGAGLAGTSNEGVIRLESCDAFTSRETDDPARARADSRPHEHGRLLDLIVHELRSPIAVVSGYLRLLEKRSADALPPSDRTLIESALQGCARLSAVLAEADELAGLDASTEAHQAGAPVAIFTLCQDVVEAAARTGEAIGFSSHSPASQARVQGVSRRLRQAIEALTLAVLREHPGRPVHVRGCLGVEDRSPAAIFIFGPRDLPGPDGEDLRSRRAAFDPWRGGLGLALPIAVRVVEAHGGRLYSLPEVSRAAFALVLPLVSS